MKRNLDDMNLARYCDILATARQSAVNASTNDTSLLLKTTIPMIGQNA